MLKQLYCYGLSPKHGKASVGHGTQVSAEVHKPHGDDMVLCVAKDVCLTKGVLRQICGMHTFDILQLYTQRDIFNLIFMQIFQLTKTALLWPGSNCCLSQKSS